MRTGAEARERALVRQEDAPDTNPTVNIPPVVVFRRF